MLSRWTDIANVYSNVLYLSIKYDILQFSMRAQNNLWKEILNYHMIHINDCYKVVMIFCCILISSGLQNTLWNNTVIPDIIDPIEA